MSIGNRTAHELMGHYEPLTSLVYEPMFPYKDEGQRSYTRLVRGPPSDYEARIRAGPRNVYEPFTRPVRPGLQQCGIESDPGQQNLLQVLR